VSGERGAGPDGSSRRMRVAEVFDGRGPTGGIVINRPQVDPRELAALTAYLTQAPVALATTKTGEDEMAPGAGLVVPRAYHTDGAWIWPAAVGYYLHRYRLPPQSGLLEHIRARGFQLGRVDEELRQTAATHMLAELAAAKRAATPGTGPGTSGFGGSGGVSASNGGMAGSGFGPGPSPSGATANPGFGLGPQPASSDSAVGHWATGTWSPAPPPPPPAPVLEPEPEPEPAVAGSVNAAFPLVGPTPPAPAVEPAESSLWLPAPAGEPVLEPPAAPVIPEAAAVVEAAAGAGIDTGVAAGVREPVEGEGFSPALTAAGNRHAAWVYEQIEIFLGFMPVDEWSVDHETGLYRQAGREFTVDALGRLDQRGRWTWAWAEPEAWSPNSALTDHSRRLREQGDRLGIKELTEPVLDLAGIADADDPETAAEMLAWTAMGVAGARGYIGHTFSDDNRVYYLAFDESIPTARPDLDAAAHYLTQGVDKFDEDPSDCVLGYVEYHGWDWSRSAEGLVVSAPGLGSFTVILAADGTLTGVRRHS